MYFHFVSKARYDLQEVLFSSLNEECILGLRGRQFEGGKCDVIVAVRGCAIFLMVLTFTK